MQEKRSNFLPIPIRLQKKKFVFNFQISMKTENVSATIDISCKLHLFFPTLEFIVECCFSSQIRPSELQLPPFREKSFADQKNPYFEPVSFWFTTENKNQLNSQISDFTIKLNQLTNKYFNHLYFRQSKEI